MPNELIFFFAFSPCWHIFCLFVLILRFLSGARMEKCKQEEKKLKQRKRKEEKKVM